MAEIKRFLTCYVPVHACNFRCQYCYLSHKVGEDAYEGGVRCFAVSPKKIADFFSAERLGGPCYFNLCAPGETMLHPELIELVIELIDKGHFVDIVTNGTVSKRFDELIFKIDEDEKKRLFIKFSFHYLELIRKGKMDDFLENVEKVKKRGISYTIEITPHDELVPYIDEIKRFCLEKFGALPHITVARNEGTSKIELLTKYTKEEYRKIWSSFDSKLFDFKLSIFGVKRKEFCYAGDWSLVVDLENGVYRQCYSGDILGSLSDNSKPINFRAIGRCKLPHCFNGHAFLGWGDIPELNAPTYGEERDRKTIEGAHWLGDEVRDFFSSKLRESNDLYSEPTKKNVIIKNACCRCAYLGKRVCDKSIGIIKNGSNK